MRVFQSMSKSLFMERSPVLSPHKSLSTYGQLGQLCVLPCAQCIQKTEGVILIQAVASLICLGFTIGINTVHDKEALTTHGNQSDDRHDDTGSILRQVRALHGESIFVPFKALVIVDRRITILQWLVCTTLGLNTVSDVIITGCLCLYLQKRKTGFEKTNIMINKLLLYVINTGIINM